MTLSDFKTYVKRDFKRTDKDTEILTAYNDTIRWLSSKMAVGDYKYQSFVNTTVGIEDYELPSNMLHLFHPIKLLLGSNSGDEGFQLDFITKSAYDLREPNPNRNNPQTGRPSAYTIWSRSILLTSIPDSSSYILEINWSKRPVDQASSTDTPSLPQEYDEILKWGTLERLYEGMGQYDVALYWGNKYHDLEDKPKGLLRDLFEEEIGREGDAIGQIQNNNL